MGRSNAFYYCSVGPIGHDGALISPGSSYRLDLNSEALRAPDREGMSLHAVATGAELDILRQRGFKVELMQGPFASQQEAENDLDSAWEEPDDD